MVSTVFDSLAAPLMRQNVNADHHSDPPAARRGPGRLRPLRLRAVGAPPFDGSENPELFLAPVAFRGGQVVAGNNFACGPSREGAVWAMMGMGVRRVIALLFCPIFFEQLLPERRAAHPAVPRR